jgi:RES domain-containing protein
MRLWRISNHPTLGGEGGLHASGRWHARGRRVVYLADHPASALLEVMVHFEIDAEDLPSHYQLHGVDVPDDLPVTSFDERELPTGWREQTAVIRSLGDNWLREASSALLRVPSALVPEASNYLINPAHRDAARLSIGSRTRSVFDSRLMSFKRF